ncbi:MAG: DUF4157 domain-containing protein, partial [Nitrososphaerota archaeon]|nr:DUF4157 domain-containing protein [Nitrososphaerota archaeon]
MSTYEKMKRPDKKADNSNCSSFKVSELLEPQQPRFEHGCYTYNFCDLPINDPTVKPERHALMSRLRNLGNESFDSRRANMENNFNFPQFSSKCDCDEVSPFLPASINAESAPLQRKGLRDDIIIPKGDPCSGTPLGISDKLAERIHDSFGIDAGKLLLRESLEVSKMGARATAQGNVIRFAPGEFKPDTYDGLYVLGHELTHVREQAVGHVHAPGGSIFSDTGHEILSNRVGAAFASDTFHNAGPVSLVGVSPEYLPVQRSSFLTGCSGSLPGNESAKADVAMTDGPTDVAMTDGPTDAAMTDGQTDAAMTDGRTDEAMT